MKKMKKWELLKKAYETYPAGTKLTWDTEVIVSTGTFEFDDTRKGWLLDSKGMAVYDGHGWAEIIKQDESKPKSILSDKCTIQVNNEREFKLLMEHYELNGWKWAIGLMPKEKKDMEFVKYPNNVKYHDLFQHSVSDRTYNIIAFADFANEIGIEVPVFVMMSEDGVQLYENDSIYGAYLDNGKYILDASSYEQSMKTYLRVKTPLGDYKVFSTKEAAENWIKEQNKPKGVKVELSMSGDYALVFKGCVSFYDSKDVKFCIDTKDLNSIFQTSQMLQ